MTAQLSNVAIDVSKHPLIKQAYDVCQAIEKCGASPELTDAVTKACALMQGIANAMDSEPVAWWTGPEPTPTGEIESIHDHETGSHSIPLFAGYTAPPAPVAVPECFRNAVSALESLYRNWQKQCWNERYTTDMAYASGVLNACRAAMLKGENHEQ